MKCYEFQGKNIEELKQEALSSLNITENDCLIASSEEKGKLFKGATTTLKVYLISDIAEEIKEFLAETITKMGLEVNFETKIRDDQITIKMFSNQNNILIGTNGKNLKALQQLVRQHIYREIKVYPYILLDVENYKEKREQSIEKLAKQIGREVLKTKQPVIMDNMNSYERRIVHNALMKFDKLTTFSEGEEPNRHIVIKYKED